MFPPTLKKSHYRKKESSFEQRTLCGDMCFLWVAPYPSGPLENLSIDDPQFFLLQAVLQVLWPTGIVDKDGQ